jgi:hypothetical protein
MYMEYADSSRGEEDYIARARGFSSVTEMRDFRARNVRPGSQGDEARNAEDLRIANAIQAVMGEEA